MSNGYTRRRGRTKDPRRSRPLRLVAFGGGTGLPVLLAGLRDRSDVDVTAVVTVGDDGGSSGRLRRDLGVAPPGDVRRCLAALAGDRELAGILEHRFAAGDELRGHALGNLIVAGLAEMSDDFGAGVERAARLLDVHGAVYPAAGSALTLALRMADGTAVLGESSIASLDGSVVQVEALSPGSGTPSGALAAMASADAVILSAGSLFTSTIAALLGTGTREALAGFCGPVLYVANLFTEPGETTGFTLADHVRAISDHGGPRVTDVLVPAERLSDGVVGRYLAEGAAPVNIDEPALERMQVRVRRAPLLPRSAESTVRHDADRLVEAVLAVVADGAADPRTAFRLASAR